MVVVGPGTYAGAVNFNARNVLLRSNDPEDDAVVAATIIDGGGATAITIDRGETEATISGFTIRNMAHGVLCANGSDPVITHNIISGGTGSGVCCNGASARIEHNTLSGNSSAMGGGIWCIDSPAAVAAFALLPCGGCGFTFRHNSEIQRIVALTCPPATDNIYPACQ